MKKGIIILFVALVCVMTSCDKKNGYTHLDGMWQVQTITKEGVAEYPEDMYFSFQMHIVEVRKLGYGSFNGTFDYTDDVMSTKLRVGDGALYMLPVFGMNAPEQEFFVEKLTNNKLILQSDYARVELRKY